LEFERRSQDVRAQPTLGVEERPPLYTPQGFWVMPCSQSLNRHNQDVKSMTEHLWFEVPNRRGFVNISQTVEDLVRKSGIQEGLCLVNAMHITASVFINDAESGLLHDYELWLEKLAPHAPTSQYQHNRTGEDNADAHMKRQIMGREVVVANHQRQTGLRPLGTDLLRRIRRTAQKTGSRETNRGIKTHVGGSTS